MSWLSSYERWVDREVQESWPFLNGFSCVMPILCLTPNLVFAWITVPEPVRLTLLAITCVPAIVLFAIIIRSAYREQKSRWSKAMASRDEKPNG